LNKTRVESEIYLNVKITNKVGSGVSYASIDYDASATRITGLKIISSHYVYNKANDYKSKTSKAEW